MDTIVPNYLYFVIYSFNVQAPRLKFFSDLPPSKQTKVMYMPLHISKNTNRQPVVHMINNQHYE